MKILIFLTVFIHSALAIAGFPSMCLYNPVEMEAGISLVTMRITNPQLASCSASLYFENPDYLPIRYDFKPMTCPRTELVSFPVPLNAPSGEAHILWQCAGESPTCIRASISGGHSGVDLDIGPLNFACENDSISIYPSAALLDIPKFHSVPSSTSMVTKFVTRTVEESDSLTVQVITLTNTVVVEAEEQKTHFVYPTFTPNPSSPTTHRGTDASTPTPDKTNIGTVGTVRLPRATMGEFCINTMPRLSSYFLSALKDEPG
ncbi:unnamed protein product [Fusarium langsethiae]|nr:unnamed protein product [Fusarium langsethiae]